MNRAEVRRAAGGAGRKKIRRRGRGRRLVWSRIRAVVRRSGAERRMSQGMRGFLLLGYDMAHVTSGLWPLAAGLCGCGCDEMGCFITLPSSSISSGSRGGHVEMS
jgi:hypothetical protein